MDEDEDAYKKTFSTHTKQHRGVTHGNSCCPIDSAVYEQKPRKEIKRGDEFIPNVTCSRRDELV